MREPMPDKRSKGMAARVYLTTVAPALAPKRGAFMVFGATSLRSEREGGNLHMGSSSRVPSSRRAVVEQVRAEAIVQTPKQRHPVGMIVRAMLLPRILEHGVATEAEIGIDTLDERLLAECTAANATYVRRHGLRRMGACACEVTRPMARGRCATVARTALP
jgi:hypothetical protein